MPTGFLSFTTSLASSESAIPAAQSPSPTRRRTSPLEETILTPFRVSPSKYSRACLSPSATNNAAACIDVVPKRGLAMHLFHAVLDCLQDRKSIAGSGPLQSTSCCTESRGLAPRTQSNSPRDHCIPSATLP